MRSSSLSSGMTDAVSETRALWIGVEASVETPEESAPSLSRRRLTTRFFLFRIVVVLVRLEPSDKPYCEEKFWRDGREIVVSSPVLPEAIEAGADFTLPKEDCMRDRLDNVRAGVFEPELSTRSDAPAQALKTVSRIEGVNNDSVLCDSDSAARRRMFFCEKDACISEDGSRDNEEIWLSSRGLPNASTAS